MLPIVAAAAAGGISFFQGLMARNDARKSSKAAAWQAAIQEEEELRTQQRNRRDVVAANRRNERAHVRQEYLNKAAHVIAERKNKREVAAVNKKNAALGAEYIDRPMVDMAGLVRDAEAAGFNPLTVIRNGGLSGYSKSVDLPGYQMMMPQAFTHSAWQGQAWQQGLVFQGTPITRAGPQAPVTSLGSVFAGALSDGFSQYMAQDRINTQQAFQWKMLEASLAGIQRGKKAGNSAAGKGFYTPGTTTSGSTVEKGNLNLALGPQPPEVGKVTVTNPWRNALVDAGFLDAEMVETRYGEVITEVEGIKGYLNDWAFNLTGKTAAQRRQITDVWAGQFYKMMTTPPLATHPSKPHPTGFPVLEFRHP